MRGWKTLILLVGLSLSWETTTWAADDPFSDPLLTSPDGYPISNYNWDAGGFFAGFHPLFGLSNLILSISVILVRLAMWVLDLGFAPSSWLAPFGAIADAVQKSRFLDHIWPFFVIIAGGVLIKDFAQHHVQRMMQRGLLFAIVATVLLLFQAVGGQYIAMVTRAIDDLCYATSGWILTFDEPVGDPGKDKFQQSAANIDKEIWQRLIDNPWQLGEVGTIGKPLGNDVDEVKDILSGKTVRVNITASTPWRDVLLSFPVGMKPRDKLAGILNEDDHPDSQAAFSATYRLLLSIFTLVSAFCAALYMLALGILLNFSYLLYLAAMIAGVIVLPLALLPWGYSHALFRWWIKALTGAVLIRIALSAYIGVTFLVLKVFGPAQGTVGGSVIAAILLYPAVFVLALWVLSRIWKRMQPVRMVTGNVLGMFGKHGEAAERGDGISSTAQSKPARRVDPDRDVSTQNTDMPAEGQSRGSGRQNPDTVEIASGNGRNGGLMKQVLRRAGKQAIRGDVAGAAFTIATGTAREVAAGGYRATNQLINTVKDKWNSTEQPQKTNGRGENLNESNRRPRIDPDRPEWSNVPPLEPEHWEAILRDDPTRRRMEEQRALQPQGQDQRVDETEQLHRPNQSRQQTADSVERSAGRIARNTEIEENQVHAVNPDTESLARESIQPLPQSQETTAGTVRVNPATETGKQEQSRMAEQTEPTSAVERRSTIPEQDPKTLRVSPIPEPEPVENLTLQSSQPAGNERQPKAMEETSKAASSSSSRKAPALRSERIDRADLHPRKIESDRMG